MKKYYLIFLSALTVVVAIFPFLYWWGVLECPFQVYPWWYAVCWWVFCGGVMVVLWGIAFLERD